MRDANKRGTDVAEAGGRLVDWTNFKIHESADHYYIVPESYVHSLAIVQYLS